MIKLYQGFYIICLFVLTGCVTNNQPKIKPNESVSKKILKKINTECPKYIRIMDYSYSYIIQEFKDGYFINKDLIGAKAQVFLIENRSESIFAKNINKARDTYILNYKTAVTEKCDLKKFTKDPLIVIKNTIKDLENK